MNIRFIYSLFILLVISGILMGCHNASNSQSVTTKAKYPWRMSNKEFFQEVDALKDAAIKGKNAAFYDLGWLAHLSDTERAEYINDAFIKLIDIIGVKSFCSHFSELPTSVRLDVLEVAFGHDGISEREFEDARKMLGVGTDP